MVRSQNEFLALLQKIFKHGCIVKISNSGSAILEVKKYPKAPIWKARTANSVKRKKSVPTPAYFINFFLVSVLRWCPKYQVSAGSLFIRQLHRNDEIQRETLKYFCSTSNIERQSSNSSFVFGFNFCLSKFIINPNPRGQVSERALVFWKANCWTFS